VREAEMGRIIVKANLGKKWELISKITISKG
jgi:hypothetical protein